MWGKKWNSGEKWQSSISNFHELIAENMRRRQQPATTTWRTALCPTPGRRSPWMTTNTRRKTWRRSLWAVRGEGRGYLALDLHTDRKLVGSDFSCGFKEIVLVLTLSILWHFTSINMSILPACFLKVREWDERLLIFRCTSGIECANEIYGLIITLFCVNMWKIDKIICSDQSLVKCILIKNR